MRSDDAPPVKGQILASGGLMLGADPERDAFDRFALELTGVGRPTVTFMAAATGDSAGQIVRFYRSFALRDCRPSDVVIWERGDLARNPQTSAEAREQIAASDLVVVGGGNTASMLAVWRMHGIDRALRDAWKRGAVLYGASAGAICWFECSITDSWGTPADRLDDGLGFLAGSCCPHMDSELERRPTYRDLVRTGFPAGLALDDAAAGRYEGTTLVEVVSVRDDARGYWVDAIGHESIETELPVRRLSARSS